MNRSRISAAFLTGIFVLVIAGFAPDGVRAYDKAKYEKINSSLACQCGCGLLVSVCTMDGCMCEGVRKQVGTLLDEGRTEKEIKQTMVSIYGKQILAAPPKSGFDLSAYILPFVFLVLGGSLVYAIATRWIAVGSDERKKREDRLTEGSDGTDVKHQAQIEQELRDMDL